MLDIKEIFANKTPNRDVMMAYGFKENDKCYYYMKPFEVLESHFKMIVKISKRTNEITSGVIDVETMEEYGLIQCPKAQGEIVSAVRDVYDSTLLSVSEFCFDAETDIKLGSGNGDLLPGHLCDGRVILFSSQLKALEAEIDRLKQIEVNDGDLSDFERERKDQLERIFEDPVVSKEPIPDETVGYGTEFSSSLDDKPERNFIMVYGLLPGIYKSLDGSTFLTRETPFGEAVFGRNVDEVFSFQNGNGISFNAVVKQIHTDEAEVTESKIIGIADHGSKRLGQKPY
ncbi:MAG: hypothetical protein ACLU8V_02645 [Oscillospiraceae bacterium]